MKAKNNTPAPKRTRLGNAIFNARLDMPSSVPSNKKETGAFQQNANARTNPLGLPPIPGTKTPKAETVKTQAVQKNISEIKAYAEKRMAAYMETLRGMVAFPGKGVSYYVKLQVNVNKVIDQVNIWASVHEICADIGNNTPPPAVLWELAGSVSSALLPEITAATKLLNDRSTTYTAEEMHDAAANLKEYSAILHKTTTII